jgi:hypothetical protein
MAAAQQPSPAERVVMMRDAFASSYGQALIAEFGKSLRKDADPACLKEKGLEVDQLDARGRDLLSKWSTHYSEATAALFDHEAYSELFTASAELEGLKKNAEVKRYLAITAPARQAELLDIFFEHFERHLLIRKVKLAAAHPLRTGNRELLNKNPTEATEKALDKFMAGKRSAAFNRYLDLSDQAAAASKVSMKKDRVVALGGVENLFRGVEIDLAALCIDRRD